MKKYLVLITGLLILSSCNNSASTVNQEQSVNKADSSPASVMTPSKDSILPTNLLTLSDAEKILGEPVHLKDSSTSFGKKATVYSSSYMANTKDKKSGKTGTIYFLLQNYYMDSSAKNRYTFIKKANEDHGIKVLDGIGDEAYFHSDNQNFYFIMVRKGSKVFNMKVNKITSTTSLDEFNRIAKQITESL